MITHFAVVVALAAAPTKSALPFSSKTSTLRNGLSVTRIPLSSPGLVAWYSVARVGSRNEVEEGHTGFAHYFEHVMFKGTKAWPAEKREALLGQLGFSENAYTSDDVTVYHLVGPSSGLDKVIEVEADRFQNLDYGEETFKTEANAVLGEYNKSASHPQLKIEETMLATAFKKHPYRHTTLGFIEDIKAMPTRYEYSKEFFKRWYEPDNVMLFVVGDFDDAKAMAQIEKAYGSWKGAAAKIEIPQELAQAGPRNATLEWKSPTLPRHMVCWKTPAGTVKGPESAAQQVLAEYVAGPISPLYKSLVLEKQIVEALEPDAEIHRDPALFCIMAVLKEEAKRAEVNDAILAAVKEVSTGKIDDRRVKAIQDHLHYGLILQLETPDAVAGAVGRLAGIIGTPDALDLLVKKIAGLKTADLTAYGKTYLTDESRTTLTFEAPPAGGAK
jgi:zinc protease